MLLRKGGEVRSQFASLTDPLTSRPRIFRLGRTTDVLYDGAPGNCIERPVASDQVALVVGDEVPSEDFVEAFEQRNP